MFMNVRSSQTRRLLAGGSDYTGTALGQTEFLQEIMEYNRQLSCRVVLNHDRKITVG